MVCGMRTSACVATGHVVVDERDAYKCRTCHRLTLLDEVAGRIACPLCHAAIEDTRPAVVASQVHASTGASFSKKGSFGFGAPAGAMERIHE